MGAFYRRVLRRQRYHHRRFAERHRRGSCRKRRLQYYFRPLHAEMFPHDARNTSHIHPLSLRQVLRIRHSLTGKDSAPWRVFFISARFYAAVPPTVYAIMNTNNNRRKRNDPHRVRGIFPSFDAPVCIRRSEHG